MDYADYITILYRHILGREPDAPGLDAYSKAASEEEDLRGIIDALLDSEEYANKRSREVSAGVLDLPSIGRPLVIVDVGAQKLASEDHIYTDLQRAVDCRVIGFEPLDHRRAEAMVTDPTLMLHPNFIGDGSPQTFYVNNDDATSSLLPLNTRLTSTLEHLNTLCTVREEQVATSRLDDVLAGERVVDFLKLDIQGFELNALKGAHQVLKRTNVVHCEVEFAQIYEGQPLFSEVEAFLRDAGFDFIDFTNLCRYAYHETTSLRAERLGWGDALFFRRDGDPIAQATIASLVYGKNGLADTILKEQRA